MAVRLVRDGEGPIEAERAFERLAREFAKLHHRRVKRLKLIADNRIVDCFKVSVQGPEFIRRIYCFPDHVKAEIEPGLARGMLCAIGGERPLRTLRSAIRVPGYDELDVFVGKNYAERVPELLRSRALRRALKRLQLGSREALRLDSGPGVIVTSADVERLEAGFQALTDLAKTFPREPAPGRPERFPQPLRPIDHLVVRWGALGPKERAAKVRSAHPDELLRLLRTNAHYKRKIDHYLARTRYPSGEAARLLRAYLDAVSQATTRLEGVIDMRRRRR